MYRNSEGYADPTAGLAMSRMVKEFQKKRALTCERFRKTIYVASPYAGDPEKNTKAAVGYCRMVTDMGHMPVASHLLYPQILDDSNPLERSLGLSFGKKLLSFCDEVWVFGEISSGVSQEIEEAKILHKPVRYFAGR